MEIYIVRGLNLFQGYTKDLFLGHSFFNIYINDLFLSLDKCDIANYADGSTPFSCGENIDEVIPQVEENVCTFQNGLR